MIVPFWCLFVGALLPYALAGWSVPYRSRQFGNVDLDQPRVQAEQMSGAGARVWGAQSNAWEALALFTATTLIAFGSGVDPQGSWATASVIWVVARMLHPVFYVAGWSVLRVVAFVTGLAMNLWIVVLAVQSQ